MSRALPPAGARQSASLIHEKCRSYQSPSSITSEPIADPTFTWQNLVDRPGFSYTLQCFVMWIAKWKSGKLGSSLQEPRSLVNARLWCVKCRLILTSNRSHSRHYRASPMHHKKQYIQNLAAVKTLRREMSGFGDEQLHKWRQKSRECFQWSVVSCEMSSKKMKRFEPIRYSLLQVPYIRECKRKLQYNIYMTFTM